MKVHLPIRRAILERRTYEAPSEGRSNKLRLDFNENTSGCSPAVRRALAKLTAKQIAMYPEYQAPTERLAHHFSVRPQELLLANGEDDALRVFFDAFVDPGSSILICEPTFPMYRYYAEIYSARIAVTRYSTRCSSLSKLFSLRCAKSRAFFSSPIPTIPPERSPRGRDSKDTERCNSHRRSHRRGLCRILGVTVTPWIRKYPQLFVARTFSKVAGLAALRLGAAIACKDSLSLVRRAMPPFPVNLAALVAGEAAVRDCATMRRYVNEVKRCARGRNGTGKAGVKPFRAPAISCSLISVHPAPRSFECSKGKASLARPKQRHRPGIRSNHHRNAVRNAPPAESHSKGMGKRPSESRRHK